MGHHETMLLHVAYGVLLGRVKGQGLLNHHFVHFLGLGLPVHYSADGCLAKGKVACDNLSFPDKELQ